MPARRAALAQSANVTALDFWALGVMGVASKLSVGRVLGGRGVSVLGVRWGWEGREVRGVRGAGRRPWLAQGANGRAVECGAVGVMGVGSKLSVGRGVGGRGVIVLGVGWGLQEWGEFVTGRRFLQMPRW